MVSAGTTAVGFTNRPDRDGIASSLQSAIQGSRWSTSLAGKGEMVLGYHTEDGRRSASRVGSTVPPSGAGRENTTLELRLGDELFGRVRPGSGPTEWNVISREIETGWTGKLVSRSSRLYTEDDGDWFWIYEIDPAERTYWVSDSNFGRMPVSDRLRARYVMALRTLIAMMDGSAAGGPDLAAPLSEMKGIFNRCLRKDQWDWFTLLGYLGHPGSAKLRLAVAQTQDLIKAVKRGDRESTAKGIARIQEAFPRSTFELCLRNIIGDRPKLEGAFRTAAMLLTKEPRQREGPDFFLSQVSKLKMERANEEHRRTLGLLSSALESRGYTVECNKLIDAFCRLRTAPAIFEVKSITAANERSQCRHALSQLYEYRYLHGLENASLWIVLSDHPSADWLVDYLLADRNLKILWIENGCIAGPSLSEFNLG